LKRRVHPACALIENAPEFRTVVRELGLAPTITVSEDKDVAGFYDVMGLATAAMGVLGQRCVISSSALVHHYAGVSLPGATSRVGSRREAKLKDCRERLAVFRTPARSGGRRSGAITAARPALWLEDEDNTLHARR
jgi:hypothetical protein